MTLDRKELLLQLQVSGIYHNGPYTHPLWTQAIDKYKAETKDQEVSLKCGGCIKKIKNYLER